MKVKLGTRIRKARQNKGLSQQNMADDLGLSVASFSNIERGITDITVSRLYEICVLLNMKMVDFFQDEETNISTLKDDGTPYFVPTNSKIMDMFTKQQEEIDALKKALQTRTK